MLSAWAILLKSSLSRWVSASVVVGALHQGRGQPAAGALATDHDAGRVDAELLGVGDEPVQRGVAVVQGGGERVLRREPVLGRERSRLGSTRERADQPICPLARSHGIVASIACRWVRGA